MIVLTLWLLKSILWNLSHQYLTESDLGQAQLNNFILIFLELAMVSSKLKGGQYHFRKSALKGLRFVYMLFSKISAKSILAPL